MNLMFAVMGMQAISSIGGGISNANAISANAAYQQSVSDTNAKLASLQAKEATIMGSYAASRRNLQTRQQVGTAKTSMAAGGVDISSGTPSQIISSIEGVGAQDELMIRNNAARQAWGHQTQALEATYAGQFARLTGRAEAQQTLLTGGIRAIEEPLSTYSTYKMWQSRRSQGQADMSVNDWDMN